MKTRPTPCAPPSRRPRTTPAAALNGTAPSLLPGLPGLTGPENNLHPPGWISPSCPPFDRVAQYYSFTLFAVSANAEGLTLKVFSPTPPALRATAVANATH